MSRSLLVFAAVVFVTACSPKTPQYGTPHEFFDVLGYGATCKPAQIYCMQVMPTTPEMVFKVTGLPREMWNAEAPKIGDPNSRSYTLDLDRISLFISVPIGEYGTEHNIAASLREDR